MTEEMKKLAGEAGVIIERDYFVPALIKSAVAHGVPQPQTEEDVLAILDVVSTTVQVKQAAERGEYPGLQSQFTSNQEFQNVRNMAKRAAQELAAQYGRSPVDPQLYSLFERMNGAPAQQAAV